MTTFLLIRHGHTDWVGKALAGHTPGVGLSNDGRHQVERLAERLRSFPIKAIYSSPLQRTLETAEAISVAFKLEVEPRLRLIEVDFGDWTGQTFDLLDEDPLWHRYNSLRSITRAPNGEVLLDVQSRMLFELEELRACWPGQTIAVVSHQDAIKAALSHYAGIPLDLFHRFEIQPASVSIVQLAEWGPRILAINNTGDF
ncbi:MAG: histidine phosphatase family protein [Bryobacteraceae bacterium]|nr:histidine phosphatase family protein [Bryobacteraceae bacterium]